MRPSRVAVIDQGSNSTRLFLCEDIAHDGPRGERITTVTALRRGAGADGSLADDALSRVEACLGTYATRINAFVPDDVVVVGTSAVRDAPNRAVVEQLVRRLIGVDMTVLSGPQEAELAYVGARLSVSGDGPVTVMDIGGGSTELVRGGPDGPHSAVSMDIGCVRHTERHLHDDPPTAEQVEELCDEVRQTATQVFEVIGGHAPLVGVAGTMTSLAAMHHGRYDSATVHGATVTRDQARAILERVRRLPLRERREVAGLHPDRAPAIVAGLCIAVGVMEADRAESVTVSERDLLDGAVLRLTERAR
jgi:exopolyphosphatase/guanosine-5'-triphosphate,3'-diphosphate pyrophosphatase